MFRHLGRPIRTVLAWQLGVTLAAVAASALLAGPEGAISAAAGGLASFIAGLASAMVASSGSTKSAGGILLGALKAEGLKIGLALFLLGLVLANYENAVIPALLVSFVTTMLVFSMAFFVRDEQKQPDPK